MVRYVAHKKTIHDAVIFYEYYLTKQDDEGRKIAQISANTIEELGRKFQESEEMRFDDKSLEVLAGIEFTTISAPVYFHPKSIEGRIPIEPLEWKELGALNALCMRGEHKIPDNYVGAR